MFTINKVSGANKERGDMLIEDLKKRLILKEL